MFSSVIEPRFYETDTFGHINNTVITAWFETARTPIFKIFSPELDTNKLPLLLAHIEVDFAAQIYFGHNVTIKTCIEKIGNSSFYVLQQAWQKEQCVAKGRAVQVHFDFKTQKPSPLPEHYRSALSEHIGFDN